MDRIFISSLQRGEMGAIRVTAARTIEALGMQPVMFETGAAAADAPRHVLLERIASCDALLLILGSQYGEAVTGGVSPTEDEFNQAKACNLPIVVLVQSTTMEPDEQAFLARVRGSWEDGRLTASFNDADDVGLAVTRALTDWRSSQRATSTAPVARERAIALARGREHPGSVTGGSKLRVVVVPATAAPLIDALALRDHGLLDDLAGAARTSGLVSQREGITPQLGADAIELTLATDGYERLTLQVGFDGSIVGEGAVGSGDMFFGSSVVLPERARAVMAATMAFAEAVWGRIDQRDQVRSLFVICAVPDARSKVYAVEPVGNSMSVPTNNPQTLLAPETPVQMRRADLGGSSDRLEAELYRAFELHGAVHTARGRR
jgi:Domain of unknown function (DUF4062)